MNVVAKLLGHPFHWDTETVGCNPSLSSIPVMEQRTFADALSEIRAWLDQPENAHEFVVLYLDDQIDLSLWVSVAGWPIVANAMLDMQLAASQYLASAGIFVETTASAAPNPVQAAKLCCTFCLADSDVVLLPIWWLGTSMKGASQSSLAGTPSPGFSHTQLIGSPLPSRCHTGLHVFHGQMHQANTVLLHWTGLCGSAAVRHQGGLSH